MVLCSQDDAVEDSPYDFFARPFGIEWESAKDESGRTVYDISEAVSAEAAFTFVVTFIARADVEESVKEEERKKATRKVLGNNRYMADEIIEKVRIDEANRQRLEDERRICQEISRV